MVTKARLLPRQRRTPRLPEAPGIGSFGPMTVPHHHAFVMGDNRTNYYDARFFGPVPHENLLEDVPLRFWPPRPLST